MKDNDEKRINNVPLDALISEIVGLLLIYLPMFSIEKYKLIKEENKKIKKVGNRILINNKLIDYSYYDNNFDYNRINSMKYSDAVMNFISTIRSNYPSNALKIFYNNLDFIEIEDKKLAFIKKSYSYYNPVNNSIHLGYKKHLYHELFHMSTTRFSKDGMHVGFFTQYIENGGKIIGESINEGYTEIITHRNFSGAVKTYPLETFMASKIEAIVGKELMEKYYFMASLEELSKELGKYTKDFTEVIKLFYSLDCYKAFKITESRNNNSFYLVTIIDILIKLYSNKLKQDYDKGIINGEEFISSLEEYIYEFNNIPGRRKFKYEKEKGITLEQYKNILLEKMNLFKPKTI